MEMSLFSILNRLYRNPSCSKANASFISMKSNCQVRAHDLRYNIYDMLIEKFVVFKWVNTC